LKLPTLTFLIASLCLPGLLSAQEFSIDPIKDNIYRFTSENHRSVYMVTDEGILITDPITTESAEWLKAELAKRHPGLPIRYMIYSHSHPDHAYGGEVFEEPVLIAHELTREDLVLTQAETRIPDVVFEDSLTVHLGDSSVELFYLGPNNGSGNVAMLFHPSEVLFVVDWITLGRLPYKNLMGYDIRGMIHSTREVLKMDFDTFVGGHAKEGTKEDVVRYLSYLEQLYGAVLQGMRDGKSLTQLKEEIRLDEFDDLLMYDEWFALNVEGVYRMLKMDAYLYMRPEIPPEPEEAP